MKFFLVIRETVCFKNGLSTFLLFSYRTVEGAFARIADFTLEYFATPKHFQEVEDIDKLLVVGFAGNRAKLIKFRERTPDFYKKFRSMVTDFATFSQRKNTKQIH